MPTAADATPAPRNRLLAALDDSDYQALAPRLERVELADHEMLARKGERFTHVYFPEDSVISIVNRTNDGSGVEVGTVGNEGMAGLAGYLETESTEGETFCQVPGAALRLPVAELRDAAARRPGLRKALNWYTQAYIAQVAQSAACNRLHGLERRCARWLLMTHDRVNRAGVFPLKQVFIAEMLGVRRAGVTVAAGALQSAGLITYRRGLIRVLDREGLEAAACECYAVIRKNFDRYV
jgi:cAMP-binding proteins - catabolite gene activator and regulatory subunit of cAMP-dependent protein kinases